MTKRFHSLIQRYFPFEAILEFEKLTRYRYCDNNSKGNIIKTILSKYNIPYETLGTGTNRFGVLIDGYAFKIALDKNGKTDNKREMKYSKLLQPYVVKVYETFPTGIISVSEYVQIMDEDTFYDYEDEMKDILKIITEEFLVGDVGLSTKNMYNWALRTDGSVCIMDFAYIYAISYKTFICSCDNVSLIEYESDFVGFRCKTCGKKYTFQDLRRRITTKDEANEIGNLADQAYTARGEWSEIELTKDKSPERFIEKKKKHKKKHAKKDELDRELSSAEIDELIKLAEREN